MGNVNLFTIFTTGFLTGGLTCMAVQGGLLAATLAQREEERLKEKAKGGNALPILAFLIAKLISYTILGFFLGALGSFFQLSIQAQVILQIFVAVFMIGTALNILDVHPIFRYFVIQPPKFLTRLVRQQSKSSDVFAPAILGAFTIFIPCGTTQAMMALAIASGNPILGATILFLFVLGTSPVFFTLGYFATKLTDKFHQKFMRVAAYAIILLAVFNLNNAISLTGFNFAPSNILTTIWCTVSFCDSSPVFASAAGYRGKTSDAVSNATITIGSGGYNPNNLTVKAGSAVTLTLVNNGGGGCASAFTIPSLGIQKVVRVGTTDTIAFTAPNEPGDIPFMCSMGMYRGNIKII